MFKRGIVTFFLCAITFSFSIVAGNVQKPVIIKKKKKISKNKVKEEIVNQLDLVLQQSSELIRRLTNLSDESVRCVRDLITNQDCFASKKECEACQKRLEQYNKKMRDMVEEVKVFSENLR